MEKFKPINYMHAQVTSKSFFLKSLILTFAKYMFNNQLLCIRSEELTNANLLFHSAALKALH